jgi:enterochelin esterase family protein
MNVPYNGDAMRLPVLTLLAVTASSFLSPSSKEFRSRYAKPDSERFAGRSGINPAPEHGSDHRNRPTGAAGSQAPVAKLVPGLVEERSLAPGENHTYTIFLNEGEAVVGEADQHGVDLVIDEFDPDGKLLRTVDSPNGSEGPEPIDLTAAVNGQYKLVIHTLDPGAKAGKYVMKIERLVPAEDNARRMAEQNFPPAIQILWSEYIKDPKAIDRFMVSRKGKGPIVEEVKDDPNNLNVTYLYLGNENTEKVEVFGGTFSSVGGTRLQRFMRTNLFFGTEMVPKDARYRYGFSVAEASFVGPKKNIPISDERDVPDALNPETFGGLSVLVLPAAPQQPYVKVNDSIPHGRSVPTSFQSASLKEERAITIYTPPGYDGTASTDLLIVFDGGTYDGSPGSLIPTPTILDNLIAARKIGPTVGVFVNNMGHRNRDLGGYLPFANFVATELIPWIRAKYHVKDGPTHVVLAGSSRGGLAASHCAFLHSDVIGNVLSQSGAFWVRNEDPTSPPWPISLDAGDLLLSLRSSPPVPVKFYVEVGRFDSLLGINRELRDVLLLKGYPLTYREFDGGHDYLCWRGSLADGLIALVGTNAP